MVDERASEKKSRPFSLFFNFFFLTFENILQFMINCKELYKYLVELHEAEKPIFAIINTMQVNVPPAPWTDYSISFT